MDLEKMITWYGSVLHMLYRGGNAKAAKQTSNSKVDEWIGRDFVQKST